MKTTNIYTMMLILSLLFLTTASVLLVLELSRFGSRLDPWNTSESQPTLSAK